MPRRVVIVMLILSLLVHGRDAFAWNKPGHMVTAAIAYDLLKKEHPAAFAKALELLRGHPQYADVISKRLEAVPAEDRDRYLFMVAARWADDVRNDPKFHRPTWHYVNFPIVRPGDEAAAKVPEKPTGDLLTTLKANLATLSGDAPDADKAVALCWVLHQVGDLHQPLHVVAFYDKLRPDGDRGGNSFYVRAKEGGAVVNLHSLWDGLILGSQTYRDAGNVAIELRNRKEFVPTQLKELSEKDPERWAREESYPLAKRVGYRDGALNGGSDRADGPVLPDGYLADAKAVAERQVVLAGHRIADLLAGSLRTPSR